MSPILQPTPWSTRPTQMRNGGLGFYEVFAGEAGAVLSVVGATATAIVIRQ